MQQAEVDKQIQNDYDAFLNMPYKGSVAVPENIIELFKKAIMALPSFTHKINFYKVKGIIQKKPNELTYSDLQDVIKVILNAPLKDLYDDIYEAIPEHINVQKFVLSYNTDIDSFESKLKMKKQTLLKLSDGIGGVNGMRIIPTNNK